MSSFVTGQRPRTLHLSTGLDGRFWLCYRAAESP